MWIVTSHAARQLSAWLIFDVRQRSMSEWRNFGSVINALELIRMTKRLIEDYAVADASELEKAIRDIEGGRPFERKEAFCRVRALCHPKAYGDLYMARMPGGFDAWDAHLARLERACATAYNKLEKEFARLGEDERTKNA